MSMPPNLDRGALAIDVAMALGGLGAMAFGGVYVFLGSGLLLAALIRTVTRAR